MNLIDRDKLIEAHYEACNKDENKSFYTWSLELMKNAPTVNEWISVSERLPEDDIIVFAIDNDENPFTAFYQDGQWTEVCCDDTYFDIYNVIAWMPIPNFSEAERKLKTATKTEGFADKGSLASAT